MIRQSVLKEIQKVISEHDRFELSEFQFDSKSEYRSSVLKIIYSGDTRYFLDVSFPFETEVSSGYKLQGECSPGRISFRENFSVSDVASLCRRISIWLNAIWEELQQIPYMRRLEEQQQRLEELWSKVDTASTEYFTQQQAEEIRMNLDDLEKRILRELEELINDTKELKKERESIKRDIETLKSTVESLNKGFWSKSLFAKMMRWGAKPENRKMLEAGYEFAKNVAIDNKLIE